MTRFPTLRTEIAGLTVDELARRFGTPTYVYDAAVIVERIGQLRAFDVIRYAQKACSNLAVLDLMRRHGVLVDAVSAFEIERALRAGYPPGSGRSEGEPPPIVFTADIFDAASLELCIQQGIHVNCGSADMIDQLGPRAPGGAITLRINPGFGHGHSQKTNTGGEQSKHGIWHEQLDDCLARAARHGVKVAGLHMHIGSGSDMRHLASVCEAMERCARKVGEQLQSISAGGGLPTPYSEDEQPVDTSAYFELWDATRRQLQDTVGHPVHLEIEPGRFLVAEAGYLITEIRAVKHQGGNLFYLVDAGFNDLARPILYGAHHPMSIAPREGPGDDATDRPSHEVIVGGPLCESGDIFTQREGGFVQTRALPEARVGDLLVIEAAGAYGAVMGSNYNSKPLAAEVLVLQGEPHVVRRRQTFEELVAAESIPPIG